jgi:predicted nucleic acid-binding protein
MNAIDTNVLLYSIDRHELEKRDKSQRLLEELQSSSEDTVLLWQVLGELGQQLKRWRREGKMTNDEFANHVRAFRDLFPLVLPTPAVFDVALDLADRFSLSHWDSMLVGACKAGGVSTLYTEDMGAPRTIDGINVVNPFV